MIDTFTTGTIYEGSYFAITYKGISSEAIPWNASAIEVKKAVELIDEVFDEVCVSRDTSPNAGSSGGFRWAVRLENIDDDIFQIGVDTSGMHFSDGGTLEMQYHTTGSILDGWSPGDGDVNMCIVRTAAYLSGSGSRTLRFRFQVLHGDRTENLNIASGTQLILSDLDNISLLVNGSDQSPIKADVSLGEISLNPDQFIAINTEQPRVTSITPQTATTPDGVYTVGDALYFQVSFDKSVEVRLLLRRICCPYMPH